VRVDSVELEEFRNWSSSTVVFSPEGINFVVGANAQGKTNLLEAVSFLLKGESFRTSDKKAMIREGAQQAVLHGIVHIAERELTVDASISRQGRDRHLVNKSVVRRRYDLMKLFGAVTFQPGDLDVVKEGPSLRRSYLDDVIASTDLKYSDTLDQYERVVRQRNTLFRQLAGRLTPDGESTLDVWDLRMAQFGETLASRRVLFVESIAQLVDHAYRDIAEDGKVVTVRYRQSWDGDLLDALFRHRGEDLQRQMSTVGPHRDDFDFDLNGMNVRSFGSQGEHRTAAFALKVAAVHYLSQKREDYPLFILDDVVSELDTDRVRRLFRALPPAQILVSGTSVPATVSPAKVIEVTHGTTA
jgi:DNA replication and repair protein RecF